MSLAALPATVAGVALKKVKDDIRRNMLSEGTVEILEMVEEIRRSVPRAVLDLTHMAPVQASG